MNYKAFIGIDVSKRTLDVAVLLPDAKEQEHKVFSIDPTGHKQLISWVKKTSKCKPEQLFICMEHTGIYTLVLSVFLSKLKINYCLENPLRIKRSMGISRVKNDKADAKMIARYIYSNHDIIKPYKQPSTTLLKLKSLLAQRDRLIKSRIMFNRPAKELSEYENKDVSRLIIKDNKALVNNINKRIKVIEASIEELISVDEEVNKNYKLVKSVAGVGYVTAYHMLEYTNNFKGFNNWREFACYSGTAPFEYSSGTSVRGRSKVSPLANKKMKSLLSMGALSAVKNDPELRSYYLKKVAEGKHKLSVQNSVKNKIISRVFAVVKRGTPYVNIANYN